MAHEPSYKVHLAPEHMPPRMYSADIQPLMQSLLATLGDIDLEYECEQEKLDRSSYPDSLKDQIRARIKKTHQKRREPYVQQLALIRQRIRTDERDR